MLPLIVRIHLTLTDRLRRDEGQTSAEYALVVLGAVGVALLVGAWAQHTDKITDLLDALFDTVTKRVR
jgi:Flp pilus assembly pilin Flp